MSDDRAVRGDVGLYERSSEKTARQRDRFRILPMVRNEAFANRRSIFFSWSVVADLIR